MKSHRCFYALGIGLGFATGLVLSSFRHAVLCFYALGIGLGFATDAPWRCP